MGEENKFLTKEEILFLDHLIKSLKESEVKLKEYYEKKDHKNFNNIKKFMLTIQKKISEVIE